MAKGADAEGAMAALGLEAIDQRDAVRVLDAIIAERAEFVRERGEGAVGPLMGVAMKELRGKVDGKAAADLLRERVRAFLEG